MTIISSGPAFIDSVDALKNEYKDDNSNTVVILGASDYSMIYSSLKKKTFPDFNKKYDKVIVFNQEPLYTTQTNKLPIEYQEWIMKADEVWDYDETNFDILYKLNKNIKLHILKPYKDWTAFPNVEKDIDFLFYGVMNDRRNNVLSELSKKYRVCFLTHEWQNLDYYIVRSKNLLNIHFYEDCPLQEQARMIRWIGSPCNIISEKSIRNYLDIPEFSYEELLAL